MFECHFKTIQQCNFALLDLSQMVRSQVCRITEHQSHSAVQYLTLLLYTILACFLLFPISIPPLLSVVTILSHYLNLFVPLLSYRIYPTVPLVISLRLTSISPLLYFPVPLFITLCPTSFPWFILHFPTCHNSPSHRYPIVHTNNHTVVPYES